jgi:hypothetical protein
MTGQAIPEDAEYLSTFLFGGGLFVLHLYEVKTGAGCDAGSRS